MFFALFLLHDGCVLHVNTFTTVQNFKGYLFQKNCFNGFVKSYSVNCEWKWGRCHENYDDLENSDLRICEIPECFLRTPQDVDVMVVFHVEPDCWKKNQVWPGFEYIFIYYKWNTFFSDTLFTEKASTFKALKV